MRLAKYMALAGIASRRGAEDIIRQGRVTVNGETRSLPQEKVEPGDVVAVDGKIIDAAQPLVYILLNKPPGYISTVADTHGRPTVMDLVKDVPGRLYPVGRLDADTRGLILLTNDGRLAHRLMHPRYGIEKTYRATVKGIPDRQTLEQLKNGVLIEGGKTAPAALRIVKAHPDRNETVLELTLTEGRKRQVKLMCAAVGHPVRELSRIKFAGLALKRLPEGQFRHLTEDEVARLHKLAWS